MKNEIEMHMEYWAKTTSDGQPGISVLEHMCHVGAVAKLLAQQNYPLLSLLELSVEEIASLAALHDIGKISPGFERKCPAWLEKNGLLDKDIAEMWEHCESDHSKISQYSIQNFLKKQGAKPGSAALWAASVGCHHGRLHWGGDNGLLQSAGMSNDEWEGVRLLEMEKITKEFGLPPLRKIKKKSPELWWLAGLTSVADWIGSNERFFPADQDTKDVSATAKTALEDIGFAVPGIRPNLSFYDLFGFDSPNEVQKVAAKNITGPGIYVIEAPMGMGKTEAALLAAYNLLAAGKASGIYFALPTQATSNRIHIRLFDFVDRIVDGNSHTRLIHGNSWLMEDLSVPVFHSSKEKNNEADNFVVRDWFASRKRALLAPFGVGTVDQALLAVVAARHFFVRRFALAGKVVVIDEVHSYDMYTGTLVRLLCHELEKLGCTVILLSATLTGERRDELLGVDGVEDVRNDAYPTITGRRHEEGEVIHQQIKAPDGHKVHFSFSTEEDVLVEVLDVAGQGGCVLFVCNTVGAAQNFYSKLCKLNDNSDLEVGLLHSRYPFYKREELENYWMQAFGKGEEKRKGCILVSTQIVEQSVDLDADLMVTELAPTDMMLQRLGRLWRHDRKHRPVKSPTLRILKEQCALNEIRLASANEIKKILGSKALIYAPYVLLRSWEVWEERLEDGISLPDDIREMVEETYTYQEEKMEGMIELFEEIEGTEYAEKHLSIREANIWEKLFDDIEGVNTRLNELPTVSMVLAVSVSEDEILLSDGSSFSSEPDSFDMELARALNRNLLRIPRYAVLQQEHQLPENSLLRKYIQGECCFGVIGGDGKVSISGIGLEMILVYGEKKGIEIIKRGKK